MTKNEVSHCLQASIVVLGAGTAGCVVAARLAESGKNVILVEAGPDYGLLTSGDWPADLGDPMSLPTSHDWGYHGSGAGGQRFSLDRARVMGGCSTHNGCTQTIGWSGDYDNWAIAGATGWSTAELRPHIERAAEKMRLYSWREDEVQPFQRAFLDACGEAGLPIFDDLFDLSAGESAGCAPVNVVEGVRYNAASAYLDELRDLPNLSILPDALIHRVVIDDGQAVAAEVEIAGKIVRIEADEFVLSAGAYGSPEVLLRSGIGPAMELDRHHIPIVHELNGVGENLHDHPAAVLEFAISDKLGDELEAFAKLQDLPEEQALAKIRSPFSNGPYDLHIYPWIEPDQRASSGWKCVLPVAQLRPISRGRVTLRSADAHDLGEVDTGFLSDPEGQDLASIQFGIEWLERTILAGSLGSVFSIELSDREWRERDPENWIRETHQHYWHPAGSCKMGLASDPYAVVDHAGRVHGLKSLRIADASIFPMIPRCTPAFPTVVVGERIAAAMLDDAV